MDLQFQPEQASNFAREYDALFWTLSALTVLFTTIVIGIILGFIVKYRRGKPADRSNPVHHNMKMEIAFLVVPTFLALALFVWGTRIFINMREVPNGAMEVFCVGKRWMWHIQHENGIRENNELHVPLGQPVKVTIISQDVIHGFYIPAFRVQYHAVPGRYTYVWFTPTKPGRYNLFCSIHCGTQHSEMGGYIYVLEPEEWAKWKSSGGNRFKPQPTDMASMGKKLWEDNNCANCHGGEDGPRGPGLANIFNTNRIMTDGQPVKADRSYLREAIRMPYTRLTKGYSNSMPEYKDYFNEDQINQLIEYIRTIGTTDSAAHPSGTGGSAVLDHKDQYNKGYEGANKTANTTQNTALGINP